MIIYIYNKKQTNKQHKPLKIRNHGKQDKTRVKQFNYRCY